MSEIIPIPWGIVVVGRWNKSILTPKYIGKTLLGHAEGEPLQIQVALDRAGDVRIKERGLAISVEDDRLVIEVEAKTFEALALAAEVAATAIKALPVTPLTAAGVSVTFDIKEVQHGDPKGTNLQWDGALKDKGYEIIRHFSGRCLKWNEARIFVTSDREDGVGGLVLVNFELRSVDGAKLGDWLRTPIEQFKKRVDDMLTSLREGGVS